MRAFQRGETIEVYAEVKDQDGVYTDPTSGIYVTITNPSGTVKVDNVAMTKITTGKYQYYYRSAADDVLGWWQARGKSLDGSGATLITTITDGGFVLK